MCYRYQVTLSRASRLNYWRRNRGHPIRQDLAEHHSIYTKKANCKVEAPVQRVARRKRAVGRTMIELDYKHRAL